MSGFKILHSINFVIYKGSEYGNQTLVSIVKDLLVVIEEKYSYS